MNDRERTQFFGEGNTQQKYKVQNVGRESLTNFSLNGKS